MSAGRRPAALLVLLLAACGSPVSQESFDRIEADMGIAEVQDILGEPSESHSIQIGGLSGTAAVWQDENGTIRIQFLNGRVKVKNFTKP